jgi:hypothetical protein
MPQEFPSMFIGPQGIVWLKISNAYLLYLLIHAACVHHVLIDTFYKTASLKMLFIGRFIEFPTKAHVKYLCLI